jgi:hypothetical protein
MRHPIIIFYHIYAYGDWESMVVEQLNRLRDSGLYGECSAMFISFIGNQENADRYYRLIEPFKKAHTIKIDEVNNKEFDILHAMWYLAYETLWLREKWDSDAYVFYIHTKGIWKGTEFPEMRNNLKDWRYMMEYFLINKWRNCIDYLKQEDVDAVGCNYRGAEFLGNICNHFSGNFWATKLRYIYTLSEPMNNSNVMYNEFWIGEKNPRVKILHESNIDHYREGYSRERYV